MPNQCDNAQLYSLKTLKLIATYQDKHVWFDWQSCNLIGGLNFRLTKVLGSRKVTRHSFGRSEGLGMRLCEERVITLHLG